MADASQPHQGFIDKFGPIDRNVTEEFPDTYTGDNPDRRHAFLWRKTEMIQAHGGIPPATEEASVVVIGGGMAGLAVTDLLRDEQPILLEQAERLGGTSKGESWQGNLYAIGAAYLIAPEPETPVYDYLNGLGVLEQARYREGGTPVELGGRIYADVFSGETDLVRAHEFQAIRDHLQSMVASRDGLELPEIPPKTPEQKELVASLDQKSLHDYLTEVNHGALPPHLAATIERYCWSALGGSMGEISAAVGLNFLAAEFGKIGVLPAGNASIAEAILKRILTAVPEERIRCDSIVVDVSVVADGVLVTYVDADSKLHCIHAKSVVMSCPKFVGARVLSGIEASRFNDIRQSLRYRSYLVANVFLNQKNPNKDLFNVILLGDGKVALDDVEAQSRAQQVTDVVMASYANPESDKSVLTLYLPLPFDTGMAKMLDPDTLKRMKSDFSSKIVYEILPALGFDSDNLAGMRITRWGHALPLAAKGLISSGLTTRLQEPFEGRVFWSEMDTNITPSIESAFSAAFDAAAAVRQNLESDTAGGNIPKKSPTP